VKRYSFLLMSFLLPDSQEYFICTVVLCFVSRLLDMMCNTMPSPVPLWSHNIHDLSSQHVHMIYSVKIRKSLVVGTCGNHGHTYSYDVADSMFKREVLLCITSASFLFVVCMPSFTTWLIEIMAGGSKCVYFILPGCFQIIF